MPRSVTSDDEPSTVLVRTTARDGESSGMSLLGIGRSEPFQLPDTRQTLPAVVPLDSYAAACMTKRAVIRFVPYSFRVRMESIQLIDMIARAKGKRATTCSREIFAAAVAREARSLGIELPEILRTHPQPDRTHRQIDDAHGRADHSARRT